jgi:hypothetical protein
VSYVLRALCTTDKKITRCAGMTFLGNAVAGVPIVLLVMLRKRLTSKVESSCPKEDGLHLVATAVDVMALTG